MTEIAYSWYIQNFPKSLLKNNFFYDFKMSFNLFIQLQNLLLFLLQMTKKNCVVCNRRQDNIGKSNYRVISNENKLVSLLNDKQLIASFFNINIQSICVGSIICQKHLYKLLYKKKPVNTVEIISDEPITPVDNPMMLSPDSETLFDNSMDQTFGIENCSIIETSDDTYKCSDIEQENEISFKRSATSNRRCFVCQR